MKKIIISIFLLAGLLSFTNAQDTRTRETKIADIVMQLPADNTARFTQLMNELTNLGGVVSSLAPRLADPGGNDARIRYAISGLSMFASNNETQKAAVANDLCAEIPLAKSDEIRDFLLIQLQYVSGSESVKTVAQYLNNPRLCDAALRVLLRINDTAANQAMLNALGKAEGVQQLRLIEALGEARNQQAATIISSLSTTNNAQLQKAVLHSLAEIASPSSEKILVKAAENADYIYDPTDALGSYILYLNNCQPAQLPLVAKSAQNMLKVTSEDTQLAAKSAALNLLVSASGEKAIGQVMDALNSSNKAYRQAALNYSSKILSPKLDEALLKNAKNEKRPEVKAEMIATMGKRGNQSALPLVLEGLKSSDPVICQSAIIAACQLGKEELIVPVVKAMNSGDEQIVKTGKDCLLTLDGNKIVPVVSAGIQISSVPAQVAFLEILAEKEAKNQAETVFMQTSASSDSRVRLTAEKALKEVVSENDVPRIANLLNTTLDKDEATALQEALYAAVSSASETKQVELITTQMSQSKQPVVFYNVLAMIGGVRALDTVKEGFEGKNTDVRQVAFDALTRWSDTSATGTLYAIAASDRSGSYFEKALMSYIDKIGVSNDSPEQKLLLLRKGLEIAQSSGQKQEIIRQIARTGTFLGLLTTGKYLDSQDKQLQQAAVQAVRTIALRHKEYDGPEVKALLNKTIAINKDPEAEYQEQEILKHIAVLPQEEGFVSLFNGKDLTGWKGLVENPIVRGKMTAKQLAEKQKKADEVMRRDWRIENGLLVFEGKAYDNLCSVKMYGDFEIYVDWRIAPKGDAGIYLRGTPQVQVWDISLTEVGAEVGSGGLYNNQKNPSKPLLVADNPVNEWNSFFIKMVGDQVTVYLNGQLVTDNVVLENYWDRTLPIFQKDAIELQAHGTRVEYRDIYVREIPRPEPYEVSASEKTEGFVPMFNGVDMSGWIGNLKDYFPREGMLVCDPNAGGRGNIYTDKEYADFIMRFEFKLTSAANNGLGIRTPTSGDGAYAGMELQILDNEAEVYKDLEKYQYHGSVYGVIPAKRGFLKPVGEWNIQEVIAKGNRIKITLNGTVILDGDIAEASKNFTQTIDGKEHPGLSNKTGHIGFLGHGSELYFRDLRIKDLSK